MLNGGGINPDGLSLDLQFAADKTLTARRGPTPVFTRSSGDNGGTTYFGPLVDLDTYTEFSTTGITNGRASWFKSDGVNDITISYTGTGWSVVVAYGGIEEEYLAAPGSEWRPDQADWSSQGFTVTTSSTFGIVKAANNEPRFDHTAAGVCRGLLIEESRTNLLSRSQDFANSTWSKSNSSISGTLYTAPTGASTANELVEDSLNAAHTCVQNAATATIGTTYTFSVFVKRKPSSNQFLLIGATNLVVASFISVNLTNGVTSTGIGSPGSPINVSSTAYPDGWYRVQFSVVATSATATTLDIRLSRDGTWANRSYLGDGVQSSLLWGAQVEAGSFPTSYIPTTTAPLTRSADVCSITGGDFNNFHNQSEGTLFADVSGLMTDVLSGNRWFAVITDGTYNNTIGLSKVSSLATISGSMRTSNVSQFVLSNSYAPLTQYKLALGVRTNDANVAVNGSLKTTVTSVTMPSTMNKLEFRDPTGASGGQPSFHLAAIRYYKKRLPNAKLVTLTT